MIKCFVVNARKLFVFRLAEECAYKVLTNVKEDGSEEPGLPYVTNVYDLHKDNAEVVENIATLFMELCEYGEF